MPSGDDTIVSLSSARPMAERTEAERAKHRKDGEVARDRRRARLGGEGLAQLALDDARHGGGAHGPDTEEGKPDRAARTAASERVRRAL